LPACEHSLLPHDLEQKFGVVAKSQGKTIDQVLNQLIAEYLEDLEDARLAEAALKRVEAGESELVDWAEAKQELHGLDHCRVPPYLAKRVLPLSKSCDC
jgi:predicted DNA-binding protein